MALVSHTWKGGSIRKNDIYVTKEGIKFIREKTTAVFWVISSFTHKCKGQVVRRNQKNQSNVTKEGIELNIGRELIYIVLHVRFS